MSRYYCCVITGKYMRYFITTYGDKVTEVRDRGLALGINIVGLKIIEEDRSI